jgi:cytochrome c556
MTGANRLIVAAAAVVLLAAAAGTGEGQQAKSPDEIIAARQAGYKHMGDAFGAMKKAIDAGADVAPLQADAQVVADWARQIPTMFPPGTESGHNTHAKPDIWSNRADFDQRSAALATEADKLVRLAAAADKAGFAEQWKVTGAVCGGCHRSYRSRLE